MFWIGFLIGLFSDAGVGALVMGLAQAASQADRQIEQQLVESCLLVHEFEQNPLHVCTNAKISPGKER